MYPPQLGRPTSVAPTNWLSRRSKLVPMNPLVKTSWLSDRLRDPGVVTLMPRSLRSVSRRRLIRVRATVAKHIPGAVFFDIDELSDCSSPLPHMLPGVYTVLEAFATDKHGCHDGPHSSEQLIVPELIALVRIRVVSS